jgi:hypothetical protein
MLTKTSSPLPGLQPPVAGNPPVGGSVAGACNTPTAKLEKFEENAHNCLVAALYVVVNSTHCETGLLYRSRRAFEYPFWMSSDDAGRQIWADFSSLTF